MIHYKYTFYLSNVPRLLQNGLHRTHIYRWENGEKDITLGKFIILVQIGLEMELEEVLKLNIFESKNEGQTA